MFSERTVLAFCPEAKDMLICTCCTYRRGSPLYDNLFKSSMIAFKFTHDVTVIVVKRIIREIFFWKYKERGGFRNQKYLTHIVKWRLESEFKNFTDAVMIIFRKFFDWYYLWDYFHCIVAKSGDKFTLSSASDNSIYLEQRRNLGLKTSFTINNSKNKNWEHFWEILNSAIEEDYSSRRRRPLLYDSTNQLL